MSCDLIQVYKGEDKTMVFTIANEDQSAFDLTGWTLISVKFLNEDDTVLTKTTANTVSVLSDEGGQIQVILTEAETALLKEAAAQDFYALIDKGTVRRAAVIAAQLTVLPLPF